MFACLNVRERYEVVEFEMMSMGGETMQRMTTSLPKRWILDPQREHHHFNACVSKHLQAC